MSSKLYHVYTWIRKQPAEVGLYSTRNGQAMGQGASESDICWRDEGTGHQCQAVHALQVRPKFGNCG